jgi:hypothetical protein
MIAKYLAVGTLFGAIGINGLIPPKEQSEPFTSAQLQIRAKHKSVSDMCSKKRKSKKAKELCERWERHE